MAHSNYFQKLRISSRLLVFITVLLSFSALSCFNQEPPLQLDIPQQTELIKRGEQLVNGLAACGFCHGSGSSPGSPLSGGKKFHDIYGEVQASNLTSHESGLGMFDYTQLVKALRSYEGRNGRPISRSLHSGMEWISDSDLQAIAAFLATQPPISNNVPRRELNWGDGGIAGLLESSSKVVGYVPSIPSRFTVQYGAYLTDHLARCVTCHNSPSTIIKSAQYLKGGDTIYIEGEEKIAPDISSDSANGIGSWSEDEIVTYLKSGNTPSGREVDQRFCPIAYYARADRAELQALAKFLKTVP